MNRTILTINAFDSSGADGVAADLKTFQTFRAYGSAAVTAILAGNTLGVQAVHPVPMELVGQQIEAVVADMPIHGVKVGILATAANVEIVATLIEALNLRNFLVVDPILASSAGQPLLEEKGLALLRDRLLPLAFCITPNRLEAEALTGMEITDRNHAKDAAKMLHDRGTKHVILTGGHFEGPHCVDLWYDGTVFNAFDASRVPSKNTLGIGATFSSIICALTSKGLLMGEAVDRAKKYLAKAVHHNFQIGKGEGPLNHTVPM
jgi:hydroxymethylpyrimidine kinase/phosphomethylpyrimidine kinase